MRQGNREKELERHQKRAESLKRRASYYPAGHPQAKAAMDQAMEEELAAVRLQFAGRR